MFPQQESSCRLSEAHVPLVTQQALLLLPIFTEDPVPVNTGSYFTSSSENTSFNLSSPSPPSQQLDIPIRTNTLEKMQYYKCRPAWKQRYTYCLVHIYKHTQIKSVGIRGDYEGFKAWMVESRSPVIWARSEAEGWQLHCSHSTSLIHCCTPMQPAKPPNTHIDTETRAPKRFWVESLSPKWHRTQTNRHQSVLIRNKEKQQNVRMRFQDDFEGLKF